MSGFLAGTNTESPRHALEIIQDNKVIKTKPSTPSTDTPDLKKLLSNLTLLLRCVRDAEQQLAVLELSSQQNAIKLLLACKERCRQFYVLLEAIFPVSPGTNERGVIEDGN